MVWCSLAAVAESYLRSLSAARYIAGGALVGLRAFSTVQATVAVVAAVRLAVARHHRLAARSVQPSPVVALSPVSALPRCEGRALSGHHETAIERPAAPANHNALLCAEPPPQPHTSCVRPAKSQLVLLAIKVSSRAARSRRLRSRRATGGRFSPCNVLSRARQARTLMPGGGLTPTKPGTGRRLPSSVSLPPPPFRSLARDITTLDAPRGPCCITRLVTRMVLARGPG